MSEHIFYSEVEEEIAKMEKNHQELIFKSIDKIKSKLTLDLERLNRLKKSKHLVDIEQKEIVKLINNKMPQFVSKKEAFTRLMLAMENTVNNPNDDTQNEEDVDELLNNILGDK